MRPILAIALATTALLSATPSFAQDGNDAMRALRTFLGTPPSDPAERDLNDQERHITEVLEQSVNEHRIDRGQADRAFNDLRTIRTQQDDLRGRHGGRITQQDHDYLRDRLAGLDRQVDQLREAGDHPRDNDRRDGQRDHDRDHADQRGDHGNFWDRAPRDLDGREDWLDRKIQDGMNDGSLDRGEARRALKQLAAIRRDQSRYTRRDRGNLSDDHRESLSDRLDDVGQQMRWDRNH
jgi:hypothetical protein